ncbi:MAG: hypothetical protein D6722_17380 [Bacteroidetes bacterium]|nr:MAG: hypothetical protein D6722_17380 [Bacteroidota bacterium]
MNTLRHLLLYILLGFSVGSPTLRATNIDSLKRQVAILIEAQEAVELMQTYNVLAEHYYQVRAYQEALPWYLKALEVAEALDDRPRQFAYLDRIGEIYFYPYDDYNQSLAYLKRAEELGGYAEGTEARARNLSRIAEVYNVLGAYNAALEYQLEALRLSKSTHDTASLALGHRNMGVLYWDQKQYKLALQNFKQSLAFYQAVGRRPQPDSLAAWRNAYNVYTGMASIGAAYLELNSLDTARVYIRRSLRLADSIGHEYGVAYSEGLMGNVYLANGQYDQALVNLKEAIRTFQEMGLRREWVSFSVKIAEVYTTLGQPAEALRWLEEAEAAVVDLDAPSILRDIYKAKAEAYEKRGDLSRAYISMKRYVQYKDSLMNEKKLAQMVKVEQQYEVRAKEEEIRDLQAQQQASDRRFQLVLLGGILLFGLVIGLLVWTRIRALNRINQLLEAKNEEIRLQNQRLASSNEDLRQFAHVASHDLREPLRSIGSFSTLLKRRYYDQLDDQAREFIDFISQGVSRMSTLLSDLMAYSVVGIHEQPYEEVDISEVIEGILSKFHKEKRTQGVRISIQNLPTITARREQMTQLFEHLIDNAIKFRSEHPPEISIRAKARPGNRYEFSVKDNGIGIDEAYKDKMFGLFLRLHHKFSHYQGTGIGLSICKKIVEQHKGRIWIDSELGMGTTVFFILPESPLAQPVPKSARRKERLKTSV